MQRVILFMIGIFLVGIAPVFITALFQKRNSDFKDIKNKSVLFICLHYVIYLFSFY